MNFHNRSNAAGAGFRVEDGYLYCDGLRARDIQQSVPHSPFYLYSFRQITEDYEAYVAAVGGMNAIISYAFKANGNLAILEHLRGLGSGAVLVSGAELRLARAAGFDPRRTVFNGNGKTADELDLAVKLGVMINIDSEFDLEHVAAAAERAGRTADVLLRINPDVDPQVHPYVSTGIRNSKFGVSGERVSWFLERISERPLINLVGVHCHLGSTIDRTDVFRDATILMTEWIDRIREKGFDIGYLNLGGGLDIDYERNGGLPNQIDLIDSIRNVIPADVTLIVEPGRSIVGNAGILLGRVIGVKTNGTKRFIVTDASMAELIRPSLYGAYHHIGFTEPVGGAVETYDVVGPICESADFLGRDRRLATPPEGAGIAVFDAGAYGYAMSSNYNARMRPAEYAVDGDRLIQIRRREDFDDYMKLFETDR